MSEQGLILYICCLFYLLQSGSNTEFVGGKMSVSPNKIKSLPPRKDGNGY